MSRRTRRTPPRARAGDGARGFSLVELLAALLLTVITVLGIAHTLGLGNGFIDRFATARAALARTTGHLETLRARLRDGATIASADSTFPTQLVPGVAGSVRTIAAPVDDPVDGTIPGSQDYFRVTVVTGWRQGGLTDSIRLETLMREP